MKNYYEVSEDIENQSQQEFNKVKDGCGVLFKSRIGNILVCGEIRIDENCFLCSRCLKDWKSLQSKELDNDNALKEKLK